MIYNEYILNHIINAIACFRYYIFCMFWACTNVFNVYLKGKEIRFSYCAFSRYFSKKGVIKIWEGPKLNSLIFNTR